ncbi:MAG: hypothetical protein AAF357_00185 [Verrucomicrobiota bacterium]
MDRYPRVYALSKKYGPPKIDLRRAEIMDSYGNEWNATRSIDHRVPENVSREDLDAYGWVYPFMKFPDLLFYLYPIALEYEKDLCIDCIDSFMYSLDRCLPEEMSKLHEDDREGLIAGLMWIWTSGDSGYADWVQCPNLQKAIGVTASWDDI